MGGGEGEEEEVARCSGGWTAPPATPAPLHLGCMLSVPGPHLGSTSSTWRPREPAWSRIRPQGQGELYYANGDMFRGEWLQDRATGYGVLMYANNNRYEGQWLEDRRHGHGMFHHYDGSRYDGEWSNGRKEGKDA